MKKKILVVDDEPELRELMGIVLEKEQFIVLRAASGNEAFEILQTHQVDLVISDIRMNNGSGDALLDRVRIMNPKNPPFMFITGFSDIPVNEAYDKGAEAFFKKPVDFKILVSKVHQHITKGHTRWFDAGEDKPAQHHIEQSFDSIKSCTESNTVSFGRGGIFIGMTDGFPKVDEIVEFDIKIDTSKKLHVRGKGICRWKRSIPGELPTGVGIEFLHLDELSVSTLDAVIAGNLIRSYIPIGT